MAYGKKYYKRKWSRLNFVRRATDYGKKFLAAGSGAALGFIGRGVPGASAGASFGWNAVKLRRPIKGRHRFASNSVAGPPRYGSNHKPGPPLYGSNPPRGPVFGSNPDPWRKAPGRVVNTPAGSVVVRGSKKTIRPFYFKRARKTLTKKI